jgi:glycogen operon protein
LIKLRAAREPVHAIDDLTLTDVILSANVQLHGVRLKQPDLSHQSHSLAITAHSLGGRLLMHFALNAYWEPLEFELPALPPADQARNLTWLRIVDTSRPSPADLVQAIDADAVIGSTHIVAARSVVMLVAGEAAAELRLD